MDARAWNWKFQVFRSRALIATKPKTETRVAGVIQIRSSTEVVVAPYLALNTASDFEHILFECLELVHVPDKLLAQDLMHQLLVFSTNLFGRDPHHSYVILINIKRKRKGEEVKYTYPDDDRFFEKMKAEEVKANLLTVRGIFIVQKSCRMNEVNAVAKTCRRDDLDVEIECPICLGEMDLGDEYVQTPCKHTYHTGCLGRWLVCTYNKVRFPACPMCRQYLLA